MATLRIGLNADERLNVSERKSGKLWAKRVLADILPKGRKSGRGSNNGGSKMARGKTEYTELKKVRFVMYTRSGPMVVKSEVYFLGHADELPNATKPSEPHRGKGLMVIVTNILGEGFEGMRKSAEYDVSDDAGWNEINRLNAACLPPEEVSKVLAPQVAVTV